MIGGNRSAKEQTQTPGPGSPLGHTRIVVPIHGSDADRRAIEIATLLGAGKSAEMLLVYVVEVAQSLPLEADMPAEAGNAEVILRDAESFARKAANGRIGRFSTELLQARSAGAAIVDEAIERGADAIVMSVREHMRHGRPTQGDTVPYVLENAPCEVIVTKVPSRDDS